jgi:hypothetical protein
MASLLHLKDVYPLALDVARRAAAMSEAASCMLSTTGTVRGSFTGCIRAISSSRPRVMSKKNFRPVSVALSVMGEVPASTRCSWKLRRSPYRGGVRRTVEIDGQLAGSADMGFLGLGLQLAHAHVFEHALTQRRVRAGGRVHDCGSVDERGGLPRSSTSQNHGCSNHHRRGPSAYRVGRALRRKRRTPAAVDNSAPMSDPQGSTCQSQFGVRTSGATSGGAGIDRAGVFNAVRVLPTRMS